MTAETIPEVRTTTPQRPLWENPVFGILIGFCALCATLYTISVQRADKDIEQAKGRAATDAVVLLKLEELKAEGGELKVQFRVMSDADIAYKNSMDGQLKALNWALHHAKDKEYSP